MQVIKIGDVTEQTLTDVENALQGNEPIQLVIDSRGGDLEVAYSIYEKLRNATNEVSAVVRGKCYSSATIILLAVKKEKRKCSKLSTFLIHSPILSSYWDGINLSSAEQIENTLRTEYNKILDIYKDRLTITDDKTLNGLMRNEVEIQSEQALLMGFVSEIEEYKNQIKKRMSLLNKVLMKLLNEQTTIKTETGEFIADGALEVGVEIDAPDGTYLEVATQTKFTVENGVVTDVQPQINEEPTEEPKEETEEVNNEEEPTTEEPIVEETKEEVVEEVATAVEEVETANTEDDLAKVLESLAERIKAIEDKLTPTTEEPTEEPIEEPIENKIENKVRRQHFGYAPYAINKENKMSEEVLKSYWTRR